MTYDGDGNLMYELDYNPDAVVDDRCIYFPTHGTKAERDLYREICDNHGWVRGDYTLTEYLNDVTMENPEVLAEYGRNYCSMTVYTYGNERISATTFNGYGFHFGCHDGGYHDIFHSYQNWHDRWKIKEHHDFHNPHHGGHGSYGVAPTYHHYYHFADIYGHHSFYHSNHHCGHNWKTAMSKIYYLYDGHGSVERVHGKDGSTFRLEYDTYGNLVAGIVERWHAWYSDIFAHRTVSIYAYSGERYNCVSELQYLRARWYDTDNGRFISEDSYLGTRENPLSRNRYIYTNNNPVNYVDPSGHLAILLLAAVAGVVAGIYQGVKTGDVKQGIVTGLAVTAGVAVGALVGVALATSGLVGAVVAGAAGAYAASEVEMTANTALGIESYTPWERQKKSTIDTLSGAAGGALGYGAGKAIGMAGTAILGNQTVKGIINKAAGTKAGEMVTGAWNATKNLANKIDDAYENTALGKLEKSLLPPNNTTYVEKQTGSATQNSQLSTCDEGGLEPGTLSNVDARKWYLEQEAKIPDLIDDSLPLEQQARQAFDLRNQYRTQARELMSDRQLAESLYATDPNLTWEQIIQKQIDKGLSGDDIYKAIIESSQHSRTSVNQSLGLE